MCVRVGLSLRSLARSVCVRRFASECVRASERERELTTVCKALAAVCDFCRLRSLVGPARSNLRARRRFFGGGALAIVCPSLSCCSYKRSSAPPPLLRPAAHTRPRRSRRRRRRRCCQRSSGAHNFRISHGKAAARLPERASERAREQAPVNARACTLNASALARSAGQSAARVPMHKQRAAVRAHASLPPRMQQRQRQRRGDAANLATM